MTSLKTNLSPERTDWLGSELAALSPERLAGPVTVVDLSAPDASSSAAAAAALEPVPCPPGGPPATIAERWAWDRRRQSFQILGDRHHPVIVGGGPEGAMYGFYRWLQDQGGYRWYNLSDDEHLAGLPPRPLPEGIVTPAIAWRGFESMLSRWHTPFLRRLMQWMLRNGWNLLLFNAGDWAARADRADIGRLAERYGIRLAIGAHAAEHFLPQTLFATQPEYFGLRNGVRCRRTTTVYPEMPDHILNLPAQPCYGNPATRRFLARRIADFIDATPEMTAFSLWPHDGSNNWCECPDCACDTPYRLMHDLAREILTLTRRPVPIELLAYSNLLTPPAADLPPESRLYTLFCPYLRPNRHRFDAAGFPPERQALGRDWPAPQPINPVDDREYGRLYQRWLPRLTASRSGLGIFAYYQLAFVDQTGGSDRSRYLYHPDLSLIADELRRFQRDGMGVFYDCSWPLPGFWPDARYAAVLGSLLWNPSADSRVLADTYYRDTLGAWAPAVQATLQRLNHELNQRQRPPLRTSSQAEAATIFGALPGATGERYRVWLEYIRLADRAWQSRKAGDTDAMADAESAIQTLFERHASLLQPHLMVDWMRRTSRGYAAKASPSRPVLK